MWSSARCAGAPESMCTACSRLSTDKVYMAWWTAGADAVVHGCLVHHVVLRYSHAAELGW